MAVARPVHPDDRARSREHWKKAVRDETAVHHYDIVCAPPTQVSLVHDAGRRAEGDDAGSRAGSGRGPTSTIANAPTTAGARRRPARAGARLGRRHRSARGLSLTGNAARRSSWMVRCRDAGEAVVMRFPEEARADVPASPRPSRRGMTGPGEFRGLPQGRIARVDRRRVTSITDAAGAYGPSVMGVSHDISGRKGAGNGAARERAALPPDRPRHQRGVLAEDVDYGRGST